ncbi:protein Asterix-like isoform X1 [Procambarus clarkii]|uniref:protein Asterix-like isoform X1 n=1 Tax=Procambarus clarkii TaxID=6728 RepID=UPI0037431E8E
MNNPTPGISKWRSNGGWSLKVQLLSIVDAANATTCTADFRHQQHCSRYKPSAQGTPGAPGEDPTTDYMNVLGMIFSMCGLMMRVVHFCSCDVLPSKPTANDTSMVQYINSSILSIVFG